MQPLEYQVQQPSSCSASKVFKALSWVVVVIGVVIALCIVVFVGAAVLYGETVKAQHSSLHALGEIMSIIIGIIALVVLVSIVIVMFVICRCIASLSEPQRTIIVPMSGFEQQNHTVFVSPYPTVTGEYVTL